MAVVGAAVDGRGAVPARGGVHRRPHDTVAAAAVGCDVLLATGMSHFVAGSVAEKLAIPHGYATFAPILLDNLFAQDWNALFSPPMNVHPDVDWPSPGG